MTSLDIDDAIKNYVRNNLSPTQDEQSYVDAKYEEIDNFLAGECFRSGSFARHTAVRPIHDLDIIWITDNSEIWQDTEAFMQQLAAEIKEQYSEFAALQPVVKVQTHSVTLIFDDAVSGEFSIDIVPATPTQYRNGNHEPIFKVPEIIKYSHNRREKFYATHRMPSDIGYTYTDPKGYIACGVGLDEVTHGNYRKTAKFLKAWRNGIKRKHGDRVKLQAFHLEQICAAEFTKNPKMTVYEAVGHCFSVLSDYIIKAPLIEDLASIAMSRGEDKYIDDYLDIANGKITQSQKELLITEISLATDIMQKFVWSGDVENVIKELLGIMPSRAALVTPVTYKAPPSPWCA